MLREGSCEVMDAERERDRHGIGGGRGVPGKADEMSVRGEMWDGTVIAVIIGGTIGEVTMAMTRSAGKDKTE